MDGSYDKGTCRVCGRYGLLSVYGDICSKCHDEEVEQAHIEGIEMKYRKKPVVIDAVTWTGENKEEVQEFIGDAGFVKGHYVDIGTLEGMMVASIGDYIIKGVKGEFYPCKPDIFAATYEAVAD